VNLAQLRPTKCGRDLRSDCHSGHTASLNSYLRQHPPSRRAHVSSSRRAPRERCHRRASRQFVAQAASRSREEIEIRRAPRPCSDGISRVGIDIGAVDLVCLIGSPRSISVGLQRSAERVTGVAPWPKAGSFATNSRRALGMRCTRAPQFAKEISIASRFPKLRLTFWRSKIVAMCRRRLERNELFQAVRRAVPYRDLTRTSSTKFSSCSPKALPLARRYAAYLHRDRVNGVIRARRGSRLAAITSGGAISGKCFIHRNCAA